MLNLYVRPRNKEGRRERRERGRGVERKGRRKGEEDCEHDGRTHLSHYRSTTGSAGFDNVMGVEPHPGRIQPRCCGRAWYGRGDTLRFPRNTQYAVCHSSDFVGRRGKRLKTAHEKRASLMEPTCVQSRYTLTRTPRALTIPLFVCVFLVSIHASSRHHLKFCGGFFWVGPPPFPQPTQTRTPHPPL